MAVPRSAESSNFPPCQFGARRIIVGLLAAGMVVPACAVLGPVELRVTDWASMPFSGNVSAATGNSSYMARVNFMKEEPGGGARIWLCDLNGNLHIIDSSGSAATRSAQLLEQARTRTAYLDFNGRFSTVDTAELVNIPNAAGTSTTQQAPDGLFPLFTKRQGYANGLVTFEFDPGYASNGKFYTVHMESVSADNSPERIPLVTKFPGFNAAGYSSTPVINPTGPTTRQAVLVEWTDSNPANLSFEGTAREILRIGYSSHLHPLGDLTFDPTAQPGDAEWGVMYLASGDGGAGESNADDDGIPGVTSGDRHHDPQRLDRLGGKVLRIIPDLSLHATGSTVSTNGRYRIPADNPFADAAVYPGACKEVWTYGHRNPHRFAWQVPAGNPAGRRLLVEEIGLKTWEEVNLLSPGGNYGYGEREGPQQLTISTNAAEHRKVSALPVPDTLPVRITGELMGSAAVAPVYPAIAYPHTAAFGDGIANGFIYQGESIPELFGRYVFGDITTGRLFYSDWDEMVAAAADADPATTAEVRAIDLRWDDPHDSPNTGEQDYGRMFEIVEAGYDFRGGVDANLPGGASISGSGRADIRLAVDASGELYVTSKSDGVIRRLSSSSLPVFNTQPQDRVISLGGDTSFTAAAICSPAPSYRWQRQAVGGGEWCDIFDDAAFSGAGSGTLTLHEPGYASSGDRYRCAATSAGAVTSSLAASLVVRGIPNAWLGLHFSPAEMDDLEVSGDLADPDHDGLVNLIEYAFDFSPRQDSSPSMPKLVMNGANVTMSFPVPRSTLDYAVEVSGDLENWSSSGVVLSTEAGEMTASYPLTAPSRVFLRIVVLPK